jgi:parallel beta-helix repeat protein
MSPTASTPIKARFVRLLATTVAASSALAAFAVSPAHAATQCGAVITASIVLENDLTHCEGDGLVVKHSDITVDLNGHTVSGTGVSPSHAAFGIRASGGFDHVTVKNGHVQGFAAGVNLYDSAKSTVTGLGLAENGFGISLARSTGTEVIANKLEGSRDYSYGITDMDGSGNRIEGNGLRAMAYGIVVGSSGTSILNNHLENSGWGIVAEAPQTAVAGNYVTGGGSSGSKGITFLRPCDGSSGWCSPAGGSGQLRSNTSSSNGGYGISVGTSQTVVTSNTTISNGGRGIEGTQGMTDGGGNRASGNGVNPQCTFVVCTA